jgi:hypothetical protein
MPEGRSDFMNDNELYIDTVGVSNAAQDLGTVASNLSSLSLLVKAALHSLAGYDSPQYSDEIKSQLSNWISIVGDPENLAAGDVTMIGRMRDFSQFLQTVASAYTA